MAKPTVKLPSGPAMTSNPTVAAAARSQVGHHQPPAQPASKVTKNVAPHAAPKR